MQSGACAWPVNCDGLSDNRMQWSAFPLLRYVKRIAVQRRGGLPTTQLGP